MNVDVDVDIDVDEVLESLSDEEVLELYKDRNIQRSLVTPEEAQTNADVQADFRAAFRDRDRQQFDILLMRHFPLFGRQWGLKSDAPGASA